MRAEIDRIMNPPIPRLRIGNCPTFIEAERKSCGRKLYALEDALEVRCPSCKFTYRTDRVKLMTMEEIKGEKMTAKRLREVCQSAILPPEYRIPRQTLERWLKNDDLKPAAWRRPNGRVGIGQHSDEDEPLYTWADVTKLRADMAARRAAGKALA